MKPSNGSCSRVFCRLRKTGSVRFNVPRPRSDKRRAGWPGSSSRIGTAELQLFLAALFKDAQDVARLAQVEARQRLEERENAVQPGVVQA